MFCPARGQYTISNILPYNPLINPVSRHNVSLRVTLAPIHKYKLLTRFPQKFYAIFDVFSGKFVALQ